MIIIFAIGSIDIFLRVKKKLSSQQLEGHTGKWPHISSKIVLRSKKNFRTTILSSLNLCGKVMMLPASISKISYFHLHLISQPMTSCVKRYFMLEVHKKLFQRFFLLLLFSLLILFLLFGFSFVLLEGWFFFFLKNEWLLLILFFKFMQFSLESLFVVMRIGSF